MNFNKFFELAKEKGITDCELTVNQSSDTSFSIFHGDINEYSISDDTRVFARGLYHGKFGTANSDRYDNHIAEKLIEDIIANASVIESDDPSMIFGGSPKYKRLSRFNKELATIPMDKKIQAVKDVETAIRGIDSRIVEVADISYSEKASRLIIINSKGLKLKKETNYFVVYAGALASDGTVTKFGGDLFFDNDFTKFDVDTFSKKVANEALSKLDPKPAVTGTYKAVLSNEVIATLASVLAGYASSEEVQKHSSLFEGKINEQVVSKKLTLSDEPINKTILAVSFDDEGVATYNKPIIKNGVLQGYLYNLSTAMKEGVESTGNAVNTGSKMSVSPIFLSIKKGKLSRDELIEKAGKGVLITSITGIHAGLNERSGNFSLQAEGYSIKDGKIEHPFDIITVSGNILDVFKDIIAIGSDSCNLAYGVDVPSLLIKNLKVAGN